MILDNPIIEKAFDDKKIVINYPHYWVDPIHTKKMTFKIPVGTFKSKWWQFWKNDARAAQKLIRKMRKDCGL